jgi:hypothetical protein
MKYRDRNDYYRFEGLEGIIVGLIVLGLIIYSLYELFVEHNIQLTNWS